ncbi:MAG: mevalonate kinase [Cardiobacteriales bacterium]|nr:MAG: mevalonate kinase [Cardiobacteriales bacterium]
MRQTINHHSVSVSAPGSIMFCGEHAVVYGYPAIVCAIEQRITVSLTFRDDQQIVINSHLANYQSTLTRLTSHPKLRFVLAAIAQADLSDGVEINITSNINPNLGLGSSAAVTAATLGALSYANRHSFSHKIIHQQALKIIHQVQQHGSGADLAASIYGGTIAYQLNPITIEPLNTTLPCHIGLQYCGYKTPTAEVLAIIADKMTQDPEPYHQLYQQMGKLSRQIITAFKHHDFASIYTALNQYQTLMAALGVSDNTLNELISQAHRQPQTLASKISGSGLGDCIMTLSALAQPLPEDHHPVQLASQGLRLEPPSLSA